jgi:hypothetical protein
MTSTLAMDKYGIHPRTLKYCVGTPTHILPFGILFNFVGSGK